MEASEPEAGAGPAPATVEARPSAAERAAAGSRADGKRIGLLVNPTSGTGRGAVVGRQVAGSLRERGHDVAVISEDSAAGATAAVRRAVEATGPASLDALVVAGGDGAVHLGVNTVAAAPDDPRRRVPLGIVPAGSGNDLARSLGLPLEPEAAVEALDSCLRAGHHQPVDAVRVDTTGDGGGYGTGHEAPAGRWEQWAAGVVSAGLDAVVNERANRWQWPRGRARYNLALARVLPTYRPRRYRVLLDGEPWEVEALLLAVANTTSYGGAMRIAPDASATDGLLDVVAIGPASLPRFVRLFPRVYAGTHVSLDGVDVRRAVVVEVSLVDDGAPIVSFGDGERLGPMPMRLRAVPGAVSVLARRLPESGNRPTT